MTLNGISKRAFDSDVFVGGASAEGPPGYMSVSFYTEMARQGHRTQEIEIHYRFNVAVATAVADSMKYDKKRKAA